MNAAKVEFRVSNDGKFQWHKCSSNPEIRTIGEHAYYCVHEHRKQDDLIDNKNATMFENHEKSLIQHCERSELRLHYGSLLSNSVTRQVNFIWTEIG